MAGGIKVTEAKAAAARLQDWVDNCQDPLAYAGDLELVLRHYATFLKKPRNGNYTRQRGYRGEAEWCAFMSEGGVKTERHFMSGMFVPGDCTTTPNCMDGTLKGQVKRKTKIPDWLEIEKHDYTAVREDRGEWFVLVRAGLFRDLLQ